MALKLPFYPDSAFNYSINLGENTYKLFFSWVDRTESWYLTIQDSSDNIVQKRIKLKPNMYLVRPHLPFVNGSNLYLLRETSNLNSIVTRDNIGEGKDFNLFLVEDKEF